MDDKKNSTEQTEAQEPTLTVRKVQRLETKVRAGIPTDWDEGEFVDGWVWTYPQFHRNGR